METVFGLYLAALYSNPDNFLSDTLLVIVIGMVVVFLVLIALTVIFRLFGKLMNQQDRQLHDKKASENEQIQELPLSENSFTRSDTDEEIIAVIAATVAAMSLSDKKSYTVRSVRRLHDRPTWASVGIAENTRPF